MKRRSKVARAGALITVAVVAGAALSGCTSSAEPITYHPAYLDYPSVKDLQAGSTDVVQGIVVDSRSEWIDVSSKPRDPEDPESNPNLGSESEQPNSEFLYTVYSVKVTDVADGTAKPGDVLEVRQLGGTVEGDTATADGAAEVTNGNEYVFFLVTMPDGMAELPNPALSVFPVAADRTVTVPKSNTLGTEAGDDVADLFTSGG